MEKTAVVNLNENAIYVVSGGNMTQFEPKQHGHDIVYWKNGEVLDVEECKRTRIKKREVIKSNH